MTTSQDSSHLEREYSPLAASDEIRLLTLQPRTSSSALTCTTSHVKNLSSEPYYEALSYEWGSKETKPIVLNGKPYDTRTNLYEALTYLRHETKTEPRILWIDAICVNQADTLERNHQVSQMARIYSSAATVIAWLGTLGEDEELVYARDALKCLQANVISVLPMEHKIQNLFRLFLGKIGRDRKRMFRFFRGLQALSRRGYWTRLWIVQEVLLARKIIMQCGKYCIPWERLQGIVRVLTSVLGTSEIKTGRGRWIAIEVAHSKMIELATSIGVGNEEVTELSLHHLCLKWLGSDCEKDVDKVFGLWALAKDCCQQAVPI